MAALNMNKISFYFFIEHDTYLKMLNNQQFLCLMHSVSMTDFEPYDQSTYCI